MNRLPDHIESAKSYGYKRLNDNRCPRTLAGKRCKQMDCWCYARLNDHSATYERHGQKVVLWEPYQAYGCDLIALIEATNADGIRLTLHGSSPYNPGSTMVIEFAARNKAEVVR